MSLSNFQDIVALSSDTLNASVERVVVGSGAGSKSIVFAQDAAFASALHLAASNPTAARTAILPNANGTIGYITNISAGTTAITNGQIVFSNSNGIVFGANGSTITGGLATISYLEMGMPYVLSSQIDFGLATTLTTNLSTALLSTAQASAYVFTVGNPINITYLDPMGGSFQLLVSGSSASGTWTISESITWWCGMFTLSGSTAGLISSASSSSSISLSNTGNTSSTVVFDPRFTNITWLVTPGEYMLVSAYTLSASASALAQTNSVRIRGSVVSRAYGNNLNCPQYTIPYWEQGLLGSSATSYNMTDVNNTTIGSTFGQFFRLAGS